jgi:hypothetical protein
MCSLTGSDRGAAGLGPTRNDTREDPLPAFGTLGDRTDDVLCSLLEPVHREVEGNQVVGSAVGAKDQGEAMMSCPEPVVCPHADTPSAAAQRVQSDARGTPTSDIVRCRG